MNRKDVTKIAHWALMLQEYDCSVEHRSAEKMRHVDAISRICYIEETSITHQLKTAQRDDEKVQSIVNNLNDPKNNNFVLRNELLYKIVNGNELIVVPEQMQYGFIGVYHERGHFGRQKFEQLIGREFFIPKMSEKIDDVVRNWIRCILSERKNRKQEGFLHPINKNDMPLDTWHMDHLGPMPSTNKNYKYILVIVDAFTKFVWIFPTKSTTAAETVNKLKIVTNVFGNARRIITDKGTAFTADLFRNHCRDENIELVHTTTGVPRGNGQV